MPNKVDQLFEALEKDGIVTKGREHFDNFFFAPGEQGYNNRYELWKALKADGIVESPTYEDFRDRLGLGHKAASPKPKQEETTTQPVSSSPFRVVNEERMTPISDVPKRSTSTESAPETELPSEPLVFRPVEDDNRPTWQQSYGAESDINKNWISSRISQRANGFGNGEVTSPADWTSRQEIEDFATRAELARKQRGDEYDEKNFSRLYNVVSPIFKSERKKGEDTAAQYLQRQQYTGSVYPGSATGEAFRSAVAYEKYTDPERIAGKTLSRVRDGKEFTDYVFDRMGLKGSGSKSNGNSEPLSKEEEALLQELIATESNDVISKLQQRMYEEYRNEGAPSSALEYIAGRAFHENLLSTLASSAVRKVAGSSGLREQFRAMAYQDYGKSKEGFGGWAFRAAGGAAPFAVDLATGGFALPSLAGKGVLKGGMKLAARKVEKEALKRAAEHGLSEAAAREAAANAASRFIATQAPMVNLALNIGSSAANFGVYDAQSEAVRQLGEGEFDAGNLLKEAARGAVTGAVLGAVGGSIRSAARNASPIGKFGADVGGLGAEIGVFTLSSGLRKAAEDGISLTDVDWADAFGESAGMVAGMKSVGAASKLGALRHPVKTIRERYRKSADYDLKLDQHNLEELQSAGYDLSNIFKGLGSLGEIAPIKEVEQGRFFGVERELAVRNQKARNDNGEVKIEQEAYTRLMKDKSLSTETKRKLHYLATGEILKPEALFGAEIRVNDDGTAQIETFNVDGNRVGIYDYKTEDGAREAYGKAFAEARMNNIFGVLAMAGKLEIREEIERTAQARTRMETGLDPEAVMAKSPESRTEKEDAALTTYLEKLNEALMEKQNEGRERIEGPADVIKERVRAYEEQMSNVAVDDPELGKVVRTASVDGKPAYVIANDGNTAIVVIDGKPQQISSSRIEDETTQTLGSLVESYESGLREEAAIAQERSSKHNPRTEEPSEGLVIQKDGKSYRVMGVTPNGEAQVTEVKFDGNGELKPVNGAIETWTRDEALAAQDQYYDELDARNDGAAKEEAVGETGQTTQPVAAPSSASAVTTDLAQMEQDMTAIDPEAPQYIGMIQYSVDNYGGTDPNYYNSVPQALVEPLKAYEEAYKASKEHPAVEVGAALTSAAESQGGSVPKTEPTSDYPRDKDGDLDVTAIQNTSDAQMMADALLADFDTETANATAQQYLTDAIKAQEKEKNPVKKNGSRKKVVDYWRDVASRLNAATEQPAQTTAESPAPVQAPTLEAGSAATEKWANANKLIGSEGVYTMDDGSDIDGRYVLVEEGASTPSHDPHTFQSSEGYPVNEQGQNVNSRDYRNSPNAQASVMQMGSDYDGRALKDVPVVSVDGIVWSGNNRTMSGILAAENGSDGKYIESLKKQASRFGFTPEQVEGMEHPRVVFVPNEGQGLDYTPQTFNRFNAPSQKEESGVEKGVKMGKVLSDRTFNLLSQEVSRFDGLKNVFKSENACREILRIMQESPEIVEVNQQTLPRYITPDGLLTEDGQNLLNAALVGYVFKDNADVLRYLDKLPKRAVNQLAEAMNELTTNARTGEYALTDELSEAMRALYEQQQSGLNMEEFLKQQDMFRDNSLYSQTAQALIKALDSKSGTPLKDILAQYNERAVGASSGQADMFSSNSREDILRDVLGIKQEPQQAPKEQPKQAEEVSATNVKPRIDIATDESFKLNHTEEERQAREKFSNVVTAEMVVASQTGEKPYKSIVDLRKRAREMGMKVDDSGRDDILLQELVEDGLVRAANQIIAARMNLAAVRGENPDEVRRSKELFDRIVSLYNMQPTIAARSTGRIQNQQYSTPLPMAYVAGMFAYEDGMEKGLEPTAGNGMLTIAVPANKVHANEIDETRLANLRGQNFAEVTDQDATLPFEGGRQYDFVIANPPFGSAEAKSYDGKLISGLDPQIALNALESMKDDGKAAIIIGGNMTYKENGSILGKKQFFTYLYDHYNVKGVVDMDGKLYQKQGTTYPTLMILIDGRRLDADREQTKVYPPKQNEALPKAETFDDLFRIANEVLTSNNKTNGNEVLRTQGTTLRSNGVDKAGQTDLFDNPEQPHANDTDGRDGGTGKAVRGGSNSGTRVDGTEGVQGTPTKGGTGVSGLGSPKVSGGTADTRGVGADSGNGNPAGVRQSTERGQQPASERGGSGGVDNVNSGRVQSERTGEPVAVGKPRERVEQPVEQRKLDQDKLPYRTHNGAFSLESVAPAAMVESMDASLSEIEKEVGSVDEFIRKELGYDTVEEAYDALAAEQMDSVAMAIYQMKKGQALIIGDQTGVGKGRQMASLIRWAVRQGKKPIFFTKTPDLFSDIYRDLVDIGSGDLRPFIINDKGAMTDSQGNVVYRPLRDKALKSVLQSGEVPDGYDYVVINYDQVNTGDAKSREELRQAVQKAGGRAKKKEEGKPKATPKADFIRKIAIDNYLFLDESHNAAGESNTGAFLQSIVKDCKAVTFASATFAKRPDTMPLYALRTAMSAANVEPTQLIGIIERGGVTLQEIMSRALSDSGQMVRRERDMSDVRTDWKTVDDPATVKRARDNYDKTITAFNEIINFQETFVKPKIMQLSDDLADIQGVAGTKRGTDKGGIDNPPFVNKAYSYTKQLLLALKVDAIVDEVEAEIKAVRHPVIALESTMESALDDYVVGETIPSPTFALSLLRGLDKVMEYTETDEDGNETQKKLKPSDLGPAGEKAYYTIQNLIRQATQDVYISPLDAIIERLNERGYKVGELTGRKIVLSKDAGGNSVVRSRGKVDKKKLAREFNNGGLDVLILNKSASTGISLHASEKFADQRPRTMIIAQPLSDINDYMQMIGRIDRTGQVHRGYYINLGLPVPAEGRFLMMLSTKLKSLNANTTTSQDSEDTDVEAPDILNKYGAQVIVEYLRDNPDIYEKMRSPLKANKQEVPAQKLDEYKPKEEDANLITGRVALLSTAEQDAFYDDVIKRYNDLIKYLDETGTNDLKITVMPLRAKTINKKVSSEGKDPSGKNPFAADAYVEEVEMDVLRKPMKAEEIRKTIETLNTPQGTRQGQMSTASREEMAGPRVLEIIGKIEDEAEEKRQKENARYEKAKAKAEDEIRERTEKIMASNRTDEEKQIAIENYATDKRQNVENTHESSIRRISDIEDSLKRRIGEFIPGITYMMPDDLDAQAYMFMSPAIFCGYKVKDKGITPSTTFAVFAPLDGRRRVEVKLSDIGKISNIRNATDNNGGVASRTNLDNWDDQLPQSSRKKGYIMTGNIIQAVADTQNPEGGYPGQLISFTDDQGNVRDGILMPDKWTPQQLRTSGVPINARLADIKTGKTFTSTDGKVRIEKPYRWSTYFTLSVPKSKKEGGKYFLDPELLKHVISGEFFTKSGMMNAEIYPEEIENVVNILANMGVRVVGENEENDTELRRTSTQLNEQYPTWLSGQTTETGQHTTQITSTVKSYEHIGHWMASSGMGGAKVLDASSGLGVGTKALRDMGFDVDDVEPYPSDKREAPTYTRYEDVDGKYDVVISNAVLNVIPDDWRADVLKNMADKLKVGGKLIINVRDAKSIESQKQKIELDSPSEILVTDKNGNIRAYQKGFTKPELKQYVEEQLGEGWKVEIANENNSGLKSGTAVVVTKMPGAKDVEYRQVGDLWSIEHEGDVESYGEQNIRTKHGLKGSSNVQYAHNADEVMQVASYLPEEDAKKLREYYLDGTTKAYYSTALDLVIVFAEKCESADDAELAEWHEQTHGNFIHLRLPNKNELAIEILNFLATEYPDAYRHITKNYEEKDWGKEAVSYFVEETIRKYGAEKFLAGEFAGNEKVRILADEIRNSFINGYNYEETGNQRGRGNEVDGRETIRPEEAGIRGGPRDRVEYDEGGNRGVPQKTGRSSGAGETESELRSIARNRNNAPGLGNVKTGSARANYEAAQAKESHRLKEAFQDSMQAVKDLQTAVIGETGGKLLDSQNAWMAENRLSSANKAQQDEFRAKEMKTLLDAVGELGGKNGSRRDEISRYLMAKHGLERNHVFAVRDARKDYENNLEKALKSIDLVEAAMKRRLKAQLDGGVIDDATYRAEVANAEAEAAQKRLDIEQAYNDAITTLETDPESDTRYQKHRKNDYSGLTSMFEEADVEAAEQKARDFVDDFEFDNDTKKVNNLWNAVRGVSGFALKKAYDSGLVSKPSYDEISKQFQHYVPLRGWSDTTTDEAYGYFNQHTSPISNPIQHAEGRSSEADDPIANLQNVAESAIISGNRNLVKQHFLNLARYHNTSLLSISDGWLQYDDVSGMWEMVAPKIDENDSPEVVNKKVEAFNEQMAQLAETDPDHYKRQRDAVNIPYIVRPGTMPEHQVFVKQGGRTYIVTVNGNPRAAQAVNGLTNPEAVNNPVLKMVSEGTRLIAKMATGLNLTFMGRNLVRDGLYVGPMVFVKEGPRYGAKYAANWWAGLAEMPVLVFKHKYGLLDRSKPLDKLFYDFIHNGGETGYTIADSVDECKKYIEREFRGGLDPRNWWDKLEGLFEYLGRVSEGISRFAAYRTSIEMGRSVDRAIYDAKDISVNFNKKGAGGKSIDGKQRWWVNSSAVVSQYGRSFIAFFNPAVQGLENVMRATRKHPWRSAALFASLAALGASQALLNKMLVAMLGGDDDDDYYNIPDYIRKSHFCIYVGGHKYIRLAMPQEFCVPFGLAGLWQERLDNPHMPNKEFGLRFAESVSMALPVDPVRGDSYFSPGSFLPTAARPIMYDVFKNEAWTGLPIYKEYEWNKHAPEYQRVYRNTGKGYVAASKWLHEFGGGDEGRRADNETLYEWNPGKIEYLAKQYLSGTYGWFAFPVKSVERIASGEKIETKDWPVVRGFVTETDERAKEKRISHYFYDMKEDMEKNKYHYDTYRKLQKSSGSDMLKYAEYQQKANDIQNSKEYREYLIWHEGDKELKKAKKRGDTDNEKLIMQLMVEAINEFRDSEGEQEDMQNAARHMFEKYQMANPEWSMKGEENY